MRHTDGHFEYDRRILFKVLVQVCVSGSSTYISDQVDARKLLHELATNTEQSATTETLWAALKHCQERCSPSCSSFFVQCVLNLLKLSADNDVVLCGLMGMLLKSPQNCASFVCTVVSDQLDDVQNLLRGGNTVLTQRGLSGSAKTAIAATTAKTI